MALMPNTLGLAPGQGSGSLAAPTQPHAFLEPIFHVHYLDLVKKPLETVEALYRHFGDRLTPDAADRIGGLVGAKPNGGYGVHGSRLEEYGLDAALERERYARYMTHFGIEAELGKRLPRTVQRLPVLTTPRRSAKPAE